LPGDLPYSELHFFSPFQDLQYQGVAKTFAWLTGPGVYHGNLVFGSQNAGDSVIDTPQLLPYPATRLELDASSAVSEIPIAIALTEFHFILLYKERIRAVNQLNDQIVFDELIPLVIYCLVTDVPCNGTSFVSIAAIVCLLDHSLFVRIESKGGSHWNVS
jgi:hypothetical protein